MVHEISSSEVLLPCHSHYTYLYIQGRIQKLGEGGHGIGKLYISLARKKLLKFLTVLGSRSFILKVAELLSKVSTSKRKESPLYASIILQA